MGGVVQGALGSASNLVGGLPIVGGMARQGLGQAGGMLGMSPQGQGGQPGGGGLFGGGKGQQGGPGGALGGLMGGGKGGQPNPFGGQQGPPGLAQFAQGMMGGTLRGSAGQQNPFGGGGTWAERHPGGGTGGYATPAPQGGGGAFGLAPQGSFQTLAQQRIANHQRTPGTPPTAQSAQLSSDFLKPYGM